MTLVNKFAKRCQQVEALCESCRDREHNKTRALARNDALPIPAAAIRPRTEEGVNAYSQNALGRSRGHIEECLIKLGGYS